MHGSSWIMNNDEILAAIRQSSTPGVLDAASVNYVDGKPVVRGAAQYRIVGNVQPVSGEDVSLLPEGEQFAEQLFVYSENREQPMRIADLVLRLGRVYEIQDVEQWGSYAKARLAVVQDQVAAAQIPLFDTTGIERFTDAP
jgi:hypothetical protein